MILDPDYCRAYTQARIVAWQYGWAIAFHGSGTRDLDLMMAPWTENAAEAGALVRQIAYRLGDWKVSEPRAKPHGRTAYSIYLPNDVRWIDLSVVPLPERASRKYEVLVPGDDNHWIETTSAAATRYAAQGWTVRTVVGEATHV